MSGDPSKAGTGLGRRLRLPRTAILRGKASFSRLFGSRIACRSAAVDFKYRPIPGSDLPPKVAFVAGKRLGNAVVRNRTKRLMREAYRLTRSKLDVLLKESGMSLEGAFIAKTPALSLEALSGTMLAFYSTIARQNQRGTTP